MSAILFCAGLAAALATVLSWGARTLTQEHWQFLATVPVSRAADGSWVGVNITWYGFFGAAAALGGSALAAVLLGSVGVPVAATLVLLVAVLAVCLPVARLVARLVEGKQHTFTVGGAFFVGLLLLPLAIALTNRLAGSVLGVALPVLPTLAVMSIAYAYGESLGRLACISFGCCYGRALATVPARARVFFERWHFRFHGATKKIAYAGGMEGTAVVPIQSVTSAVFGVGAVLGTYLFLRGESAVALLVSVLVTQVWRALSEFLRADWRGGQGITPYQWMAVASTAVAGAFALVFKAPALPPASVAMGMRGLWHPGTMVMLFAIWACTLFYLGRSTVTTATVRFGVAPDAG